MQKRLFDRSIIKSLSSAQFGNCHTFSISLLQKSFDTLINTFIENKIGIADHFLSDALSLHLKENLTTLYAAKQLMSAGTGQDTGAGHNHSFRTDIIYWLDREHNNVHENLFLDLMDEFVQYLNETCYTGINSYEFHYTLYETGSSYKKHLDQFHHNDSRKYSMIMYLNNDWQEKDGGELCIHQKGYPLQHISPSNGKSVFFQSNELEHEVLITHRPRMSITGWLKS